MSHSGYLALAATRKTLGYTDRCRIRRGLTQRLRALTDTIGKNEEDKHAPAFMLSPEALISLPLRFQLRILRSRQTWMWIVKRGGSVIINTIAQLFICNPTHAQNSGKSLAEWKLGARARALAVRRDARASPSLKALARVKYARDMKKQSAPIVAASGCRSARP